MVKIRPNGRQRWLPTRSGSQCASLTSQQPQKRTPRPRLSSITTWSQATRLVVPLATCRQTCGSAWCTMACQAAQVKILCFFEPSFVRECLRSYFVREPSRCVSTRFHWPYVHYVHYVLLVCTLCTLCTLYVHYCSIVAACLLVCIFIGRSNSAV